MLRAATESGINESGEEYRQKVNDADFHPQTERGIDLLSRMKRRRVRCRQVFEPPTQPTGDHGSTPSHTL